MSDGVTLEASGRGASSESPPAGALGGSSEVSQSDVLLRKWIRQHQVCWELTPHHEVHEGSKLQVGFDLTLFARHPEPLSQDPGCAECFRIYESLCGIALRALPADAPAIRVSLAPFDAAFHLRPCSGWAPEVTLGLRVEHRHRSFESVDDALQRCAASIETQLRTLGIQSQAWSSVKIPDTA